MVGVVNTKYLPPNPFHVQSPLLDLEVTSYPEGFIGNLVTMSLIKETISVDVALADPFSAIKEKGVLWPTPLELR